MSIKNTFLVLLGVIIIFGIWLYTMFNGTPWGKYFFKVEATKYIKQKYPLIEIQIKGVQYSFKNSGLFDRSYSAVASPTKNPKMFFKIYKMRNSNTNKYNFTDNYLVDLWEYEVESELDPFVKKFFSNEDRVYIEIDRNIDPFNFIDDKGNTPEFVKIRDKLKGKIEIVLVINRSFDGNQSEEEYKKIFECIKFIKEKNYAPDVLRISFYPTKDETYNKSVKFEIIKQKLIDVKSSPDVEKFKL